LARTGMAPCLLTLEVAENILIEDHGRAITIPRRAQRPWGQPRFGRLRDRLLSH
jgi:hypothetical protein